MQSVKRSLEEAGRIACQAALEKKGEDVVLLDLIGQSSAADFFVLVTSRSQPHAKAIAQGIQDALGEIPLERKGIEGYPKASWILLDYHGLVVHIFAEEERDYYNLQGLWASARVIPVETGITPREENLSDVRQRRIKES